MPFFRILLLVSIFFLPVARFFGLSAYVEPVRFSVFFVIFFLWVFRKRASVGAEVFWGRIRAHPLTGWIVGLSMWLIVTTIVSADLETSIIAAGTHGFILLYFYLFADVLRDEKYYRRLLIVFLASGMFVCVVALLQYLVVQFNMLPFLARWIIPGGQRVLLQTGDADILLAGGYRSAGTLFHPNSLGTYLSLLFPFVITLSGVTRHKKGRLIFIVCSVLLGLGLFCSGSRGALMSSLVSSLVLAGVFWRQLPRWAVLLTTLLLIGGGVIFSDKIVSYLRLDQGLSGRNVLWQRAGEMIEEHPWAGIGPGGFPKLFVSRYGFASEIDLFLVVNEFENQGDLSILSGFTAHNLFLNYAVEMGLFAVFLAFALYFIYFREFFRHWRRAGPCDDLKKHVMIAATAAVAGNLTQAFFEASINFWTMPLGMSFALVVSLGLVSMKEEQRKAE